MALGHLTISEKQLIYRALRREDGSSLCPDWSADSQRRLTSALDLLRQCLLHEIDTAKERKAA